MLSVFFGVITGETVYLTPGQLAPEGQAHRGNRTPEGQADSGYLTPTLVNLPSGVNLTGLSYPRGVKITLVILLPPKLVMWKAP